MYRYIVLVWLCLGLAPTFVSAEIFTNRPQTPYELLPMIVGDGFGEYLGELHNSPVAYEFALATTTVARFVLTQTRKGDPEPLALLIVRELPNGRVELVERMSAKNGEWKEFDDGWLGMSWWALSPVSVTLEPGSYRVEVSSPVNEGRYRLVVGEVGWEGYGAMWGRIKTTNTFFGRGIGDWLESWFVLGHVLLVVLGYLWFRNRRWCNPILVASARLVLRWFLWLYAYGRQRFWR